MRTKRFIFSIIALAIAMTAGAQNEMSTAILQSGETVTMYTGINALIDAHTAAKDGDVITLSAGKFNGTTISKCSIILQEIGGQFENSFACTLLGNAAECKYFPNDCVWASLRFSTREYQGQFYQDILVQDIISFTTH